MQYSTAPYSAPSLLFFLFSTRLVSSLQVVILSIIELFESTPTVGISVLRCARLLRIFKVTRYSPHPSSPLLSSLFSSPHLFSDLFPFPQQIIPFA